MIAIVSNGFQTDICGWIGTNPYLRLDGSRSNPFCGLLVLQMVLYLELLSIQNDIAKC